VISTTAMAYLDANFKDYSYLSMRSKGASTCFNTVTSNVAESLNFQLLPSRGVTMDAFVKDVIGLYSSHYHAATLLRQVGDVEAKIPAPAQVNYRVWPPIFGVGKGRSKTRLRNRVRPTSLRIVGGGNEVAPLRGEAHTDAEQNLMMSLSGLDAGVAALEASRETPACCSLCGAPGHNAQSCTDADMGYALGRRPGVVGKIKKYEPLPVNKIRDLASPVVVDDVGEEEAASCELQGDMVLDAVCTAAESAKGQEELPVAEPTQPPAPAGCRCTPSHPRLRASSTMTSMTTTTTTNK